MARKRPKVSLTRGIQPRSGDIEQLFATEGDVEQAAGLRLLAVRLDAIMPDPAQPRNTFPETSLGELSESIQQDGVIQPIEVTEVRPGMYMIVHGERRWRAAQLAGLETIPAVVRRRDYDTITRFVRQMVENVQREDLNDVDRAAALIRLRDLMQDELAAEHDLQGDKGSWNKQITWSDVGRRLGLSRQRIHQLKQLLTLPTEIQDEIRAGRLSERDTRVYQGLQPHQQLALHEFRVAEKLENKEVRQIARQLKDQPDRTVYEVIEIVRRPLILRPGQGSGSTSDELSTSAGATQAGRSPAEAGLAPIPRADMWPAGSSAPGRDMKHNINRVHWARDHLSRVRLPSAPTAEDRESLSHVLRLLQRDLEAILQDLE